LIENAIDAMHSTKNPSLSISVQNKMGKMIFKFSDNGPGIPKEILNHIFEPYVTSKTKGTGLGLAIVYKIIEEHKGIIKIINEKKGGTTVHFSIPLNYE